VRGEEKIEENENELYNEGAEILYFLLLWELLAVGAAAVLGVLLFDEV
jgi:type III secretory pathway component EscS